VTVRDALRRHWPLVLIVALAAGLMLSRLGVNYLWEDEGDTAVLARTILQHGVPMAWDGVTFTAPDFGQRLTDDFVMISHPWLQYYAAAASFALFGASAWAARLPFALAGVVTVVLVYLLVWTATRRRAAAVASATLLVLSVQFLLFARQARNYTLTALLTCLLVWWLPRMRTWKGGVVFALIGVLLFHAHPIGIAAVSALGLVAHMRPGFSARRCLVGWAVMGVWAYAVPWMLVSSRGYQPNTTWLTSRADVVPRLLQFAVEYSSATPALGVLVLAAALGLAGRRRHQTRKARRVIAAAAVPMGESDLIVSALAVVAAEAVVVVASQSPTAMWITGLHQAVALIPLTMVLAGIVIARVSRSRRWVWVGLMCVFGFTRLSQITPWAVWEDPTADPNPTQLATAHVPASVVDRVLRTDEWHFLRSLGRRNAGVVAAVSEFLERHAAPGDVVVTNYSWEPIYFHTHLPQGLKVASSYSIYPVARAKQLPDYVFTADRVRWIVWRPIWGSAWGQDCGRLLRTLASAGVPVTLVRSFPETMWENRENLNFHRFADNTYIFPWYSTPPDVRVYRVDWPDDMAHAGRR
jgi:4-amino-4-deoxy-L-arabinose transferase-like glycosyltransferase